MELRKSVPRHRRSVSDPTELMPSLRLALAGEGKRQRSPSSRSPFADGPRKQKSAFDVIEDASMFEEVGPGEQLLCRSQQRCVHAVCGSRPFWWRVAV